MTSPSSPADQRRWGSECATSSLLTREQCGVKTCSVSPFSASWTRTCKKSQNFRVSFVLDTGDCDGDEERIQSGNCHDIMLGFPETCVNSWLSTPPKLHSSINNLSKYIVHTWQSPAPDARMESLVCGINCNENIIYLSCIEQQSHRCNYLETKDIALVTRRYDLSGIHAFSTLYYYMVKKIFL